MRPVAWKLVCDSSNMLNAILPVLCKNFAKFSVFFQKSDNSLGMPSKDIYYSDKYNDETHEYRHVILPKVIIHFFYVWMIDFHVFRVFQDMAKLIPKSKLMTETEWREIGVQQSPGWIHYMIHEPEPNILLFKRALSKWLELSSSQSFWYIWYK